MAASNSPVSDEAARALGVPIWLVRIAVACNADDTERAGQSIIEGLTTELAGIVA
jgi:hypothetical protein